MDLSDQQLVERIGNDDQTAFAALVKRYHRRIYSIVYRMIGNVSEAEDLCQEIFLRVYQNLSRYDHTQPFAPWICRVACNHTLNYLKRRTLLFSIRGERDEEGEKEIVDQKRDPEQEMISQSREKILQKALLELPENYRMAFTLKYVEELTAEEVGEIMQIPRNTIKTWLVRAREALRSKLEHEL